MSVRELQRHAVDTIKRHALVMSLGSPRAEAHILTEYLWTEECAESPALRRGSSSAPPWLDKLMTRQLDDERRHAALLRDRLTDMGVMVNRPPPALARAKLWWLQRAVAPYAKAFSAGPVVTLLAVAAQLEATGVRLFRRHLAVLEDREPSDPTKLVIEAILADETRHARSCAAAVQRLVRDDERPALDELREKIATIDRAFGVTISIGYWMVVAMHTLRDRRAS